MGVRQSRSVVSVGVRERLASPARPCASQACPRQPLLMWYTSPAYSLVVLMLLGLCLLVFHASLALLMLYTRLAHSQL